MAIVEIQQARSTATEAALHGPALYLSQLRRELPRVMAGELRYRPVATDDYWRLWLATRHPEFNRCLPWPAPTQPAGALERMRDLLADEAVGRLIAFACERPSEGRQWVAIFRFTAWRDGLEHDAAVELALGAIDAIGDRAVGGDAPALGVGAGVDATLRPRAGARQRCRSDHQPDGASK